MTHQKRSYKHDRHTGAPNFTMIEIKVQLKHFETIQHCKTEQQGKCQNMTKVNSNRFVKFAELH